MDKKEILKTLQSAEELYVIMSACTKMPFVFCDPETCDDEVFLYESEEDIKREAKRFLDAKQPVQIAKIENKTFVAFYGSLYTMGVNCIVLNGYMENEARVQLTEFVKKPGSNDPEKTPWIENPGFHLTSLYFMQEVRRQKLTEIPEDLKELLNEIQVNYERGTFLVVYSDKEGVPLVKLPNEDTYQPIFTDLYEFKKFNGNNQFKAAAVAATKIPNMLAKEAKGVIVNPFGVGFQIPIMKKQEQ